MDNSQNIFNVRSISILFIRFDSLSLEYHPLSIIGCGKSSIPPIRYLQCPAAVTVRHLQRFLSSKFTLNLDSGSTQIDIIYEDELLPTDFTLMDIAYCYNWKRVSPSSHMKSYVWMRMIGIHKQHTRIHLHTHILTHTDWRRPLHVIWFIA